MFKFRDTRLGARSVIGFGVGIVLILAVAVIGAVEVSSISDHLTRINDVNSVKQRYAINFRGSVHDRAISVRDVVLVDSTEQVTDAVATIEKLAGFYEQSAVPLDAMFEPGSDVSAEEREILDRIKAVEQLTLPLIEQVVSLRMAGNTEGARELLNTKAKPALIAWLGVINEFIDLQESMNKSEAVAARAIAEGFPWVMLAVSALAALASVGFAAWNVRSIRVLRPLAANMLRLSDGDLDVEIPMAAGRNEVGEITEAVEKFREAARHQRRMAEAEIANGQVTAERARIMSDFQAEFDTGVAAILSGNYEVRLNQSSGDADISRICVNFNELMRVINSGLTEAGQVMESLASADLTRRMEGSYLGPFDALKQNTNAVADKISGIVLQLSSASKNLKSATGELLSGTDDLAARTGRQASNIQQTALAMDKLAKAVTGSTQEAELSSASAGSVATLANEGRQVMGEATMAMERIRLSSGKISNIIGLIDDIAFQTNLLALNASVEAARAGDAGKGFAVVAVEVRRLAQSAAQASNEVKALIDQSASEVTSGSKLVDGASQKLVSILSAAEQSSSLMQSISSASIIQSREISQISAAINELEQMTQHNASLVEETNAAIGQAEVQASEMDKIVDVFSVGRKDRLRQAA